MDDRTRITDHRSPFTDNGSPITDHGAPITDHGLPITDHESPFTDYESRITDHRSRFTDDGLDRYTQKLGREGLSRCWVCGARICYSCSFGLLLPDEETMFLVRVCLECLRARIRDANFLLAGEQHGDFFRGQELLFQVAPPLARWSEDPFFWLATVNGFRSCPVHPGVFFREECPVCELSGALLA